MIKFVAALVLVGAVLADVSHLSSQEIPIIRLESDINPDGQYTWAYETGNGISAQEQGVGGQSAQGNFAFTSPEGVPIAIQYIADENGYQPAGDAIPQPPPIPEAILRAISYNEAHPEKPSKY